MKSLFEKGLDRAIELLCVSALCGLAWLLISWMFGEN